MRLRVLFVCTGNICRSPIAERLSVALARSMRIAGFEASSAGTQAVIKSPMHRDAAAVLRSLGGDPAEFSARQLSAKILSNADLILVMSRSHRDEVLGLAPQKLKTTFTLAEASRLASFHDAQTIADLFVLRPYLSAEDRFDVQDPIGRSVEVFAEVGDQIADLLVPVIEVCRRSVVTAT